MLDLAEQNRMGELWASTIDHMDRASAEGRVQSLVLGTWMPVAAIAHLAELPTKTALAILQRRLNDWELECRRVRIDGKNPVHCFRKRSQDRQMIFGVWVPVTAEVEAEEA